MEILIKRRKTEIASREPSRLSQPSPYDRRYGEWGRVELLNSEDNSVDVFLDIGVYLKRVPVSSQEWVVPGEDADKEYDSGERNLPPIHARVFIMMPTGTYDDCFVLCSGFSTIEQTKPYMEKDKEGIKERITPSGWHITDDYVTGSHKSVSLDGKTSIDLDYGNEEEPKEEPELHMKVFDGDSPGVKVDVVSAKTVEIDVFDELKLTHDTEEKTTDFNLFDDTVLHHKKEETLAASFFEELLFEHKKGDSITIEAFDESVLSHKKGESISGEFFGGEASFTHKKGDSTVIKAFDSEITLKQGQVIIKTSSMITHDSPTYKFTGNTSVGSVTPKGIGVYCAIPICPFSGLAQTG